MDKITGFVYNGNGYFYLRNIQGDILSIYKCEDSSLVASYQYDAWGNQTVTNYGEEEIGNINPIRYRGYYYDEETGLYYLNSRYYDPKLRRFICPDTLSILDETMSEINGLNLYMYCKDNPVMYVDPSGCFAITLMTLLVGGLIAGAIGAGIGLGTAIYKDVKEDGIWFNGDLTDYLGRILGGFVAGFGVGICTILGAGVGAAALNGTFATLFTSTGLTLSFGSALGIGSSVAFLTGMMGYAIRTSISRKEKFNVYNMLIEGGINAISGALSVFGAI